MLKIADLIFGVEIECTGQDKKTIAAVIAKYFDTTTTEDIKGWKIVDKKGREWYVVRDGSVDGQCYWGDALVYDDLCNYQCELVTPKLQYNSDDRLLLSNLCCQLQIAGVVVNNSCGMHIHVDMSWVQAKDRVRLLRNLLRLMYRRQNLLLDALDVADKRMQYCMHIPSLIIEKTYKDVDYAELKRLWYRNVGLAGTRNMDTKYNSTRYHMINYHNLFSNRFEAVELRFFNATLQPYLLEASIQLALLLVAYAYNRQYITIRDRQSLQQGDNEKYMMHQFLIKLGAVGVEYRDLRLWLLKNLGGDSAYNDRAHRNKRNAIPF